METTSLTATIVILTAAEDKILTDGNGYAHSVAVGSPEEASKWLEIDIPESMSGEPQSSEKFELACMQFRSVCGQIAQFTGIDGFRGGFDEYANLMNSEAFRQNPTMGLTLAMMWSGANEYCVYEGSKIGLGQPQWWYRCWGIDTQPSQ